VEDWERAQKFADRFAGRNWPRILERYAHLVNPLLKDLFHGLPHYWVTAQSEYSTDIIFKSASDLRELSARLLSHSALCFGAKEVMSFLGRILTGHFLGEIVSDTKAGGGRRRIPGARIKHRVKENWLKMYDKDGAAAAGYCLMDLTAMNAAPYGPRWAEVPSMQSIIQDRISDGG
jgi:hypothetical protein